MEKRNDFNKMDGAPQYGDPGYDASVLSDEEEIEEISTQSPSTVLPDNNRLLQKRANPAMSINPSGYQRTLDKASMENALVALEEMGYDIPCTRRATVTEAIDMQSILQVIDAIVAHAVYKMPNLFCLDDDVTDVFITPVELKSYLVILVLNRMRDVNQLSGAAIGSIPWVTDDAPVNRAMFEMLAALAPFVDGHEKGVLFL